LGKRNRKKGRSLKKIKGKKKKIASGGNEKKKVAKTLNML